MNVLIEKDFQFQAGVCFQSNFLLNSYKFTLTMSVLTESVREQNIAMERIKYMINESLSNIFFVPDYQKETKNTMKQLGFKVCCLPDEPFDQIVSLVLLLKFNAIAEGRINVDKIKITTTLSDNVTFYAYIEDAENGLNSKDWWNERGPNTTACVDITENIYKLQQQDTWESVGLGWED